MLFPIAFLDAVLPSQGTRIFNFIMPGAAGDRAVWQVDQLDTSDNTEADRSINWALNKGADVYVAIAGYGDKTRAITRGTG